jgi:hypothetical protein
MFQDSCGFVRVQHWMGGSLPQRKFHELTWFHTLSLKNERFLNNMIPGVCRVDGLAGTYVYLVGQIISTLRKSSCPKFIPGNLDWSWVFFDTHLENRGEVQIFAQQKLHRQMIRGVFCCPLILFSKISFIWNPIYRFPKFALPLRSFIKVLARVLKQNPPQIS